MAVEFRILGPLEIRRDGAPVPLRAPAQRTFLAALLVEHNRVVSVDSLAEALWPEEQPHSARHALEMNASRVRKLLGVDGAVVARSPGYVLEIDPSTIDAVRFERLLGEARELDPARAAARAADALALWRGPAYADFTFAEFAQEEIARLEELRLEAEDERFDALLELGQAAQLIGELDARVAAAPLRERRRAQLMIALYRSGRQADALAAFRDFRELLLDELGLEPGAELRDLERAILQQDPTLVVARSARTVAGASRRPASVVAVEPEISLELDPEEHERQKRRAAEAVARVAAQFDALQPEPFVLAFAHEDHVERAAAAARALGSRVGIATGDALVGEGAVGGPLVDLARQRARAGDAVQDIMPVERPPDTPFVGRDSDLARLRDARVALVIGAPGIGKSRLLYELSRTQRVAVGRCRAYGPESLTPLNELAAALGAPDALSGVRAEEIPLTLRRLAGNAVVAFDDVQWADQLVLDAIEYLAQHVRTLCLGRDDLLEERPEFLRGAERIVLAPLTDDDAAHLADGDEEIVARAEGNPLFIEQLRAHASESDAPLPKTLHSLLAARLDRLPPSERVAIQRAAVIGRDFDAALVDARPALASLARRSLIEASAPSEAYEERFRFAHALIREAAYESIPHADRARLHEVLADELDARGASDEVVGFHLERAAGYWPVRDRHALRLGEDAGRRLAAAGMARWRLGDAAGASLLFGSAIRLLTEDLPMRYELACERGVALTMLGQYDAARAAFSIGRASSERRIELRAELEDATIDALQDGSAAGRMLELAEQAVPVFDAAGDQRALGRAWFLLAWLRGGALGRWAESEHAAERALSHYRAIGFPWASCLGAIAAAVCHGPTPVAVATARCVELLEEHGADLSAEAVISSPLAHLYGMGGEFEQARAALERAETAFRDLGRLGSIRLSVWPTEARLLHLAGALEEAAAAYIRNCDALREVRGGFHLVTQASELAAVLDELGRYDEAAAWTDVAEQNAREFDREGSAVALAARALVDVRRGDGSSALEAGRTAVLLAEETDAPATRATAYLALAAAHADAATYVAAALDECERKGNVAAAARIRARTATARLDTVS